MTSVFCLSQAEEWECFTPVTTLETTYHVSHRSFTNLPVTTPSGIFKIHIWTYENVTEGWGKVLEMHSTNYLLAKLLAYNDHHIRG
jgi:hypothetical protein